MKSTVRAGQRAKLKIAVTRADGEPVTGPYEVRIDGRTVMTRQLRGNDDGRATVVLPKRGPGTYAVRVVYLGSATAAPSRSEVRTLTVRPRAHQHPVALLHGRPLLPSMF